MGHRLFAAALAACFLAPSPASACSPFCGVAMAPLGTSAMPAHLPVNGAFVEIPGGGASVTSASIVRTRGGATQTLTLEVGAPIVALPDPQIDDLLVITAGLSCGGAPSPSTTAIRLMPQAPIPTTLGVLEVDASHVAPVAVFDNRGSCTSDLSSAVAPYRFTPDPSLDPWADALIVRPMLDDAPWSSPSDGRVAPSFVFAHCATPLPSQSVTDTTPGEHRLRIDGTIRGTAAMLSSQEITFELSCNGGGSGCAVSPPRRTRACAPLGLALVLALVVVRRARRR